MHFFIPHLQYMAGPRLRCLFLLSNDRQFDFSRLFSICGKELRHNHLFLLSFSLSLFSSVASFRGRQVTNRSVQLPSPKQGLEQLHGPQTREPRKEKITSAVNPKLFSSDI
jgi:hypothetical protein